MAKVLDLPKIKQSLENLDRIATEHPELLGKSTADEWETTLKEHITERPTKKTKAPQAIRLPEELLSRVDAYAESLESEIHISVSRSDAIRRLLVLGLEDAEDIRDAEKAMKEPGEIPLSAVKAEYGL